MQHIINKLINLLKWPVATYMVIILPALFASIDSFSFSNHKFIMFAAGILGFVFSKIAGDSGVRVSMQTLIHELTHAFFAFITFHKVKNISLKDGGGDMMFEGESNWLIVIAPYFFPLVCFLYMIFVSIWALFMPINFIITIIFGYLVGLHVDTVVSQIHEKQTDLPKVSYPFCLLFLPGANFLTIGSLLAFNSLGWSGVKMYFLLINNLTIQYIVNSVNIVLNL